MASFDTMSSGTAEIRVARAPGEFEALERLRRRLHAEVGAPYEEPDDHTVLFAAELDGEIVGTAQLRYGRDAPFDDETLATHQLERFAEVVDMRDIVVASQVMVTAEHRLGPLAPRLFGAMFEHIVERGVELVIGHCEMFQVNRYESMGLRSYALTEHPSHGALVLLALAMSDVGHARAVDSPFLPALERRRASEDVGRGLSELLDASQIIVSERHACARYWAEVEHTLPSAALAQRLGLDAGELQCLLANSLAMVLDAGATMIRKGHASRLLYILLTGSLVVRDRGVDIASVDGPGEIVGEVAFFSRGPRTSDVIVGPGGARVLAVNQRTLDEMIAAEGSGAAKLLFTLTRGLCLKLRERAAASGGAGEFEPPTA